MMALAPPQSSLSPSSGGDVGSRLLRSCSQEGRTDGSISGMGARPLCTFMLLSLIGLFFEMVREGLLRKRGTGWRLLMAADATDLPAILAVPEVANGGVALAYMLVGLASLGTYAFAWGIDRAILVCGRCMAQIMATITGSRTVHVGRSTTYLFATMFDYQGQTHKADERGGSVTRAVAGYCSSESSVASADREPSGEGSGASWRGGCLSRFLSTRASRLRHNVCKRVQRCGRRRL